MSAITPDECVYAPHGDDFPFRYCPNCTWVEAPSDLTALRVVRTFVGKPVQVRALQLRWENWPAMVQFIEVGEPKSGKAYRVFIDEATGDPLPVGEPSDLIGLVVPTLEGNMLARQGDWIIKGTMGEFYPCKHEVFAKKYELKD